MIAAANLPALTRDVDFVSDGIFAGCALRICHAERIRSAVGSERKRSCPGSAGVPF
jgi:hypothetical protein